MKKNIKKIIILCLIVSTLFLTACGSITDNIISKEEIGFMEDTANDTSFAPIVDINNNSSNESSTVSTNRKIIEEYETEVETKEFDKFVERIKTETSKLGGYIESSTINNSYKYRNATIKIRIPQTQSNTLNDFVDKHGNVTHSETNTTDVTLTYVDIESRLASYKLEKAKLEELMANATNLNDILEIQDRLTDVIYEIEAAESKLRTYDNLIEYTTITLTIIEVQEETVIETLSTWEKIGNNLKNGFKNVKNFLVGLFVALVSSTPYLLLFAGLSLPIIIILTIIKRLKKTRKNKDKKGDVNG